MNASSVPYAGQRYRVVTVDLRQAHLDLDGQGERGHPGTVGALDTALARTKLRHVATTNAGIDRP